MCKGPKAECLACSLYSKEAGEPGHGGVVGHEVRGHICENALVKYQVLLIIQTAYPTLSCKGHFISTWQGSQRKAGI